MDDSDIQQVLSVARAVAREAAQVLLGGFRKAGAVRKKGVIDLVTDHDLAVPPLGVGQGHQASSPDAFTSGFATAGFAADDAAFATGGAGFVATGEGFAATGDGFAASHGGPASRGLVGSPAQVAIAMAKLAIRHPATAGSC